MVWHRLLIAAGITVLVGCSVLYTGSPRYGRGHRERKAKTQPAQISQKHPLEERKGKLPWPVSGVVVGQFGVQVEPKYGTKTKNSGIDISCKSNSAVRAVGKGRVSYADFFMGQGLMVIVEHGGGYHSIYSRLIELKVRSGDEVVAGDTIGLSGDVLHFELRIGGKAVDPLQWLEKK